MFWKRKRKQRPAASVEEQLRALAACGLVPETPDAVGVWIEEWGREALEERPFDLVLACLGGDREDADGAVRPWCPHIWYLDTECIYDASDYVDAVERLAGMTRGDLRPEDVSAQLDDEAASVRFRVGAEPHQWELAVRDDWIDPSLIDRFARLLAESGSSRRVCVEKSTDQTCLIVCPTRAEFEGLTALSPVKFQALRPGW